jgi:hypothetical protein
VLLIAGDFCAEFTRMFDADIMRMRQTEWLDTDYREWEAQVPAKHILATPGNHDWIARLPDGLKTRLLIDEGCEIDGVKFYFSPWVPPVMAWNYMLTREQRKRQFALIPHGLDVLVTHCPPHQVLDTSYSQEQCGCPELRQVVYSRRPKYHVFGHIHEGQRYVSEKRLGATMCYNVAMWKEQDWHPLELTI